MGMQGSFNMKINVIYHIKNLKSKQINKSNPHDHFNESSQGSFQKKPLIKSNIHS